MNNRTLLRSPSNKTFLLILGLVGIVLFGVVTLISQSLMLQLNIGKNGSMNLGIDRQSSDKYVSDKYGYSFRYPVGWQINSMEFDGSENIRVSSERGSIDFDAHHLGHGCNLDESEKKSKTVRIGEQDVTLDEYCFSNMYHVIGKTNSNQEIRIFIQDHGYEENTELDSILSSVEGIRILP